MDNVLFSVTIYILVALLLLSLVLLFASVRNPRLKKEKIPGCQPADFFPPRKRKLYADLSQIATKHDMEVFPQVSAVGFIRMERGVENELGWLEFLRGYYADFLLCEGENGKPIIAVMQDEGAARKKTQAATLEFLCDKVGIPVLHVREYNLPGLEKALMQKAGLSLPKAGKAESVEQEKNMGEAITQAAEQMLPTL